MALSDRIRRLFGLNFGSYDAGDEICTAVDLSTTNCASLLTTLTAVAAVQGVADASITVGGETDDVRPITIQLKDRDGADMAVRSAVLIIVLADGNGDAFATTGGSTGIAIGTDGALLALVAKKAFIAISEADGDIDLTWTDTGTEACRVAVVLPSGKMIISATLANAA